MTDEAAWLRWEWVVMFAIVLGLALRELWSVRRRK